MDAPGTNRATGTPILTDIAHAPQATHGPPPGVQPAPFGPRLFTGVMAVLVAAIMSGLNNRVGALALVDIRGVWVRR